MDGIGVLAAILFVMLMPFLFGVSVGHKYGKDAGRIEVSSGQVSCALKTNKDKTSEWTCELVQSKKGE